MLLVQAIPAIVAAAAILPRPHVNEDGFSVLADFVGFVVAVI